MRYLDGDIQRMRKGLYIAADAVSSTLGPEGMNVFISEQFSPRITNDGARIANSLNLRDAMENAGAYIVKSASAKQNDDAGDGTTTAVLFLKKILEESGKIENQSAAKLRADLTAEATRAVALLEIRAKKIKTNEVKDVALAAGEYEDVAELIAEAYKKLGGDAFITVEDSKDDSSHLETLRGYEVKNGYLSPYFITDQNLARAVIEDCVVAVFNKKIGNINHLTRVLEILKASEVNRLALFVDEIDDKVLSFLIGNKLKGNIEVCVVRPLPAELDDIAGVTGAVIIGQSGVEFHTVSKEHLGHAEKIIIDNKNTLILTDALKANSQASKILAAAKNEDNVFLRDRLEQRAARLRGEIAILKIGAANDMAREHKKDKADDAIHSVRNALEGGVVEGAGRAWAKVAEELKKTKGENETARGIIVDAILRPSEILGDSSGDKVRDAFLVEKHALLNAVEAAGIFLTTKYAIIEEPSEKDNPQN